MNAIRIAAAVLLTSLVTCTASAQFRPPVWPQGEMKYFRVTITNQSDITTVFTMRWDGQPADRVTLEPGRRIVAETKQPPAPTKPELTVKYVPAPGLRQDVRSLESGHIDPRTNNPGIIYDFVRERTNLGTIIVLRPR